MFPRYTATVYALSARSGTAVFKTRYASSSAVLEKTASKAKEDGDKLNTDSRAEKYKEMDERQLYESEYKDDDTMPDLETLFMKNDIYGRRRYL